MQLAHVEIRAMALAELGRFEEATPQQENALEENQAGASPQG